MTKLLMLAAVSMLAACVTPGQPIRPQRTVVRTEVPGLRVALVPVDDVFWRVTVVSARSEQIQVIWDESSFVGGDGVSHGRLLRGATRLMDTARAQPSSPLVPGATLMELVVPETLANYQPPTTFPTESAGPGEAPTVIRNTAPKVLTSGMGRLSLVIEGASGRERWEAALYFGRHSPVKPAPAEKGASATPAMVEPAPTTTPMGPPSVTPGAVPEPGAN